VIEGTMPRAKAKVLIAVFAAALLVAGLLFHRGSPLRSFAVSPTSAAPPARPTLAAQERRSAAAIGRATPLPELASARRTREEKSELAVESEAARIAQREAKLDQLSWAASRPPPAVDGDHAVSKSEAALPAAEKVRQTESMIERLRERIARAEQPSVRPASLIFDGSSRVSELQRARMKRRVAELEQSLARESAGATSEGQ
jgi:hypothetical protein